MPRRVSPWGKKEEADKSKEKPLNAALHESAKCVCVFMIFSVLMVTKKNDNVKTISLVQDVFLP